MRVALYARVSSEAQEDRSPIGSQVEALRQRMAALDHEVVAEFLDDGHSGARLDRPGLDALRAHAQVLPEAFYRCADRAGLLVLQERPLNGS